MTNIGRVVIAMSGGVDSSVAAALLVQQGYDVVGMMLRLWSEPGSETDNRCCSPDAMPKARRVAAILGIPFYAVDARQVFRETVVDYFINGYLAGNTPNPCLICNRHIRWEFLLSHALKIGADHMATGHYARISQDDAGVYQLRKAKDFNKDQTYILHVLTQEKLSRTIFPVGVYSKAEVREMARQFGLPVAESPDSQDLCFLGDSDYRQFLLRNAPQPIKAGPILNRSGETLGMHQGLAFYTIGQRKGLGISSTSAMYVIAKDEINNALIVGNHGELGNIGLEIKKANWIAGEAPAAPFRANVKIRYKSQEASATITPMDNFQAHVLFDQPLRDITPGQAAVIYTEDICLGGGVIA